MTRIEADRAAGVGGVLSGLRSSRAGLIGAASLAILVLVCVATLPYTLGSAGAGDDGRALPARYKHGELEAFLLPPTWSWMTDDERGRLEEVSAAAARSRLAREGAAREPTQEEVRQARPFYLFGTDALGRDVFVRCLTGGGVSIGIGIAAAAISVLIGTVYGAAAGWLGGRWDGLMMRAVDVLYGLPYLLLVVLLAVAGDALLSEYVSQGGAREAFVEAALAREGPGAGAEFRERVRLEAARRYPARELSEGMRASFEILVLLAAIGGVSWLTMSRVIRGQVLSLRAQPFMEAARAIGTPPRLVLVRHLLPNLVGPIVVYATLTAPQAILQESFLSFLGIGVRPPLPSWGSLAAEGLSELNPVRVRWWLIAFPCLLLGGTLLALNLAGEGLREALDPRSRRR